jgi:hypothetical protein
MWQESFGQLIYASVHHKVLDCQKIMLEKVLRLESEQPDFEILMMTQIERSQLPIFLKSIQERFSASESGGIAMAVRNVALSSEEFDITQIPISDWLDGNDFGFAVGDQQEPNATHDRNKADSHDQSSGHNRIDKYLKALPDNIGLLKVSSQLVSQTSPQEGLDSISQEYVDSLILGDVKSWRFYRYDKETPKRQTLFLGSRLRDYVEWRYLIKQISVSFLMSVAFGAYFQARKISRG